MQRKRFPAGWRNAVAQRVLVHCDRQRRDKAVGDREALLGNFSRSCAPEVLWQKPLTWFLALALAASGVSVPAALRAAPVPFFGTHRIPTSEFSHMVQGFSEPGGDFPSDNLTSNELSYQHIIGKLKEMGISGGAYIGVGPEQNFTYIAQIRPRIAFLVDIRRQAIVQHLLYKAIFHRAENRAQFLALLFSKPFPATRFDRDDTFEELLNYIRDAPTSREAFLANLKTIQNTIEQDFQIPLSPTDVQGLAHVYSAFWQDNLTVGFRFGHGGKIPGPWGFPELRDLLLATDLNGKRRNFLAREEDYQFVRKLQNQNRVIPVVGDVSGTKALRTVANYLRKNDYVVSAFYTSNVEEYLYEFRIFNRFEENVGALPINDRSVFIRAVRSSWSPHSFWTLNQQITPFLQKIAIFLNDYRAGLLPDYGKLVTTHYISGESHAEAMLPMEGRK